MVATLLDELNARREADAKTWGVTDELLAAVYDRLGETAWLAQNGRGWTKKPPRLRRPWEPEKPKGMSAVGFIKAMAGAA